MVGHDFGASDRSRLEIDFRLIEEGHCSSCQSVLERDAASLGDRRTEPLLANDAVEGGNLDRHPQRRQHFQAAIQSRDLEAFEEFRLAITEELHGAAIAAFLQGQQRAHAFVRCATDHIDEHDIRVLIIDHPQQSRAVRELDDIDGLPPELFAELLAQTKILINDEA